MTSELCGTVIYDHADGRLSFVSGQKTIEAGWSDDYPYQVSSARSHMNVADEQKLTALAPSMDLVAVGTTDNRVAILRHPSLEPVAPAIELKSELVDLDWGGQDGNWVSPSDVSLKK
jgi:prolactin regulatory element-binding protein